MFWVLCRRFSHSRRKHRSGDARRHSAVSSLEQIIRDSHGDHEIINESDCKPCDEYPTRVLGEDRPSRVAGSKRAHDLLKARRMQRFVGNLRKRSTN
jgi:hypothetical protein